VADVFDALTSSRPYKKGWPVEDALRFIRDGAGKHFDPAVVEVFERRFDDVLAIRAAARDAADMH
jgi:putative two-component system response regulator